MNITRISLPVVAALAFTARAGDMNSEPSARKPLTLEGARTAIAAIEKEAARLEVGGAIAVVDVGGSPIALSRLDGTLPAASDLAIRGARSAAMRRGPAGSREEEGGASMAAPATGVPIVVGGELVGAVGVSGSSSARQDEELALLGARAVEALAPAAPMAGKRLLNLDADGLALRGYDPVAYFTESRAVKGDPRFRSTHGGATYRFATADHKARFDREPSKYEPAFGGFCGYGASVEKLFPGDPELFQVLDGRLVLQFNRTVWDLWVKDVAGHLAKADRNWPGLVEKNGK